MILTDKKAVIVGGGRGLGRAIALAYANEGADLAIADLDLPAAEETLELCAQKATGLALPLDISDTAAIAAAFGQIEKKFGRIDILVNCAAICLVDPLAEVSPERWDRVFAVNTRGAFFCLQHAAKAMKKNGGGRIIMISTPASRLGFPHFASYGASKAAVDSFVRSAALAWAPDGITVNTIVPGRMTGGMVDALDADLSRVTGRSGEELAKERTKSLPMQRRVEPSEVAAAAVWLASDAAAYVTAERFNFTGGMELQ